MRGVQQALIDMYNDRISTSSKPITWKEFMDEFLVVLIADGYMNIGAGQKPNDPNNFKVNAVKKGFFDP